MLITLRFLHHYLLPSFLVPRNPSSHSPQHHSSWFPFLNIGLAFLRLSSLSPGVPRFLDFTIDFFLFPLPLSFPHRFPFCVTCNYRYFSAWILTCCSNASSSEPCSFVFFLILTNFLMISQLFFIFVFRYWRICIPLRSHTFLSFSLDSFLFKYCFIGCFYLPAVLFIPTQLSTSLFSSHFYVFLFP